MEQAISSSHQAPDRKANGENAEADQFEFGVGLREFIDSFPNYVILLDEGGHLLYCNRVVLEYAGRTLEEMVAMATEERLRRDFHPEDARHGDAERMQKLRKGEPFELERRVRGKDGMHRWFLVRYQPLNDKSGNRLYWICTGTDIEHTKRTDEQLRLVVDTIPAYIHIALPDGSVDYLNQQWLRYLGLPLENVLARRPSPVRAWKDPETWAMNLVRTIHPDDLEGFTGSWGAIIRSGKAATFEARIRRLDGHFRAFLFQPAPLYDESGGITHWYVAGIDIEDRRRSEEELRLKEIEAASQLRQAIDTTPFLAWTARPDGSVEFLNNRWLEYSGLTLEEALDWKFLAAIHPDDIPPTMEIYQNALKSGNIFEAEARIRRCNGEYRWFLFRGCPFRDETGAIVRWFGANTDIEDRKRSDEALRASEQSLRLVIDTIPGLVHMASPAGEVEYVSQKELDYFGKTLDELKVWEDVVHPDDLERLLHYWQERIQTGDLYDTEVRLLRADGVYRWIHVQGVTLRNSAGQILRWYFLMTDIDERKKAEENLKRNERYLAEGQRLSRTGSFSWSASSGEPIYLSEECLRIFDFDPARGLPTWQDRLDIVDPADRPRWVDTMHRAIAEKSPYQLDYRILTRSGVRKNVRVVAHPVFDCPGELVEFVGTVIDTTDQHKAEEAMRETERHLRILIETIPALVWCTAPDGRCIYVNRQHLEYAGCSMHDLLGLNWLNFMHPDDVEKTREAWLRSVQTGEKYERIQRIRRADGSYRWFHTFAEPLRDSAHQVTQWYGLNIDIDDSRNLTETLRATQMRLSRATQIATVAELSASIAHEINQPLGAVVTTADACEMWLSADPPNLERAQIAIQRIARDARAAAEVIQRIRALFKQSVPNKIPLDLNEVISEVLRLVSHEIDRKNISVATSLRNDLPKAAVDRIQMQQLMMNLVHNAIESMDGVEGRLRSLALRTRHETNGAGAIVIEVSDAGAGIDDADKIFESFYTTKERGMGMGLSICRSIVDAHGGSLWARRNEKYGTTFSFTIPIDLETS